MLFFLLPLKSSPAEKRSTPAEELSDSLIDEDVHGVTEDDDPGPLPLLLVVRGELDTDGLDRGVNTAQLLYHRKQDSSLFLRQLQSHHFFGRLVQVETRFCVHVHAHNACARR